jgi:hemerythrin-like domain-containing protein
MQVNMEEVVMNNKFNIIDVLLLDHKYLKECIKILKSVTLEEDNKVKVKVSKCFLDALGKHSIAEKKVVYTPLLKIKDFRQVVIEGEIEHGVADAKVEVLSSQLTGLRTLSEELEIEMKVLAEMIEHHIKIEESNLLPKMKKYLDKIILNEMGFQFMKLRNFSKKDLRQYPKLQHELAGLNKFGHKISKSVIEKVQKHVMSIGHHRS